MPTIANHLKVDTDKPDGNIIAAAAHELAHGRIGIIPTSCLYGIGTNALLPEAVNRIFTIKKRSLENPLLVLIGGIGQIDGLATSISPLARRLMGHFWPGRVTFLLTARPRLPKGIVSPDNKVGIRVAAHPITAALVERAGVPITGTSANLSGQPGCHCLEQMDPSLFSKVDLVLDAGPLLGGVGSSIVDLTLPVPQMLRCGALDEKKFKEAFLELQ